MSCDILFRVEGPVYHEALAPHHRIHDAWDGPPALAPEVRAAVRVVVTNGTVGLTEAEMAMLPALGLICTVGTGYEAVDVAAARARGIAVTHAAGVNAGAVAEHAIGMILALTRRLCRFDAAVRAGTWRGDVGTSSLMSGRRIGIFGMGGIGQRLGRLAAAFDMPVSYCSRTAKNLPGWTFHADLRTLAQHVDVLVIAAPGGPATFHAVDDAVLDALGPNGIVVNVGRGSIIDTNVLIAALEAGRIGGAALDVLEEEPEVPEALRRLPNVVLSPHVAGLALEVQRLSAALMMRNIDAFLAGKPLVTPVPV
ncbi:NAD(P)-dependent oxidoreductase [Falsirhodobacter sp. 20TX0035]|uniref:NAD(P)-dependent oxidoreductase n=1 Tax=Falsirhodobacter sp. 20TX0035 TaxID=3022019 RepID=UPI00232F1CBC|nr:NAD(P)-dependent oxidoreductase [Falsirhodobacter sp. 20TX0035]MDB6452935.1 NAD(P)-dependent oxidoreductase [Falsirhodobacter sp. 20TX0035]